VVQPFGGDALRLSDAQQMLEQQVLGQLLGGGSHGPVRQVKTAAVAGREHGHRVMPHRFRDSTGDRDG